MEITENNLQLQKIRKSYLGQVIRRKTIWNKIPFPTMRTKSLLVDTQAPLKLIVSLLAQ